MMSLYDRTHRQFATGSRAPALLRLLCGFYSRALAKKKKMPRGGHNSLKGLDSDKQI